MRATRLRICGRIALLAAVVAILPHPSGAAGGVSAPAPAPTLAPAAEAPEPAAPTPEISASPADIPAPAAILSEVPAAAANDFERGQDLYRRHQYAAAASALAGADEKAEGRCGPCVLARALAEAQLGHHRLAVELTRKGIGEISQPRSLANANNQLAVLLTRSPSASAADLTAAEEALRRATALVADADQGVYYANLAEVQRRAGRYPAAIEVARQALARHLDRQSSEQARVALCRARAALTLAGPGRAWHTGTSDRGGKEEPSLPAGEGQVTKPKRLWAPPPPPAARAMGRMVVESIIDREGCVVALQIDKPLDPHTDQAVLDTVQSWVFEPATLNGKPVSVHYTLTVTFNLGGSH